MLEESLRCVCLLVLFGRAYLQVQSTEKVHSSGWAPAIDITQDVFGILGDSATLPLRIPSKLKVDEINWSSERGVIVRTKLGEIDRVFFGGFMNRLSVPAGNFSLQILNLREEDGGSYTAQITTNASTDPIRREYKLEVFKRLPKPDIKVIRGADIAGNETCKVTLICTVETGSEGVSYTWTGEVGEKETVGSVLNLSLTLNESSLTYTCTARNPASTNSRTVTLWETCGQETPPGPPDYSKMPVIAVVLSVFVLLVVLTVVLYACTTNKRKKLKVALATQTVYAQVTKAEGPTPREENTELMEDHSSENVNGKTIYSTVNFTKQQNVEAAKSVYDTVKFPNSPAPTTYDKVM